MPSPCLQISMLNKFSEMIRGNLTKIQRQKIVALVTIEVHARDVIEKMIKSGCGDVTAFEWLSQLRLYWDKVCVTIAVFIRVLKSNWFCVTTRHFFVQSEVLRKIKTNRDSLGRVFPRFASAICSFEV